MLLHPTPYNGDLSGASGTSTFGIYNTRNDESLNYSPSYVYTFATDTISNGSELFVGSNIQNSGTAFGNYTLVFLFLLPVNRLDTQI